MTWVPYFHCMMIYYACFFFVLEITKIHILMKQSKTGFLLLAFLILPVFLYAGNTVSGHKLKKPADFWAMIPSGTFHKAPNDSVSIQSFWIRKTETTNLEYREFITWLIQNGQREKAISLIPDSTVWRSKLAFNEPYVTYYYNHPAYANYPVVGVNKRMAEEYCRWLTLQMNENLSLIFPKWKNKKVLVRLPVELEWMYAASGGNRHAVYPWGGPYLRNSQGDYLCNFRKGGEECITYNAKTGKGEILEDCKGYGTYMGTAGSLNDNANITVPVQSYWPNAYGVYNMAGNVAEIVADSPHAKGGSWKVCGADVSIFAKDPFADDERPRADRGFRVVMSVTDL